MCYFFIGSHIFDKIEVKLIGKDKKASKENKGAIYRTDGKKLSFKRDIEPFYLLSIKIGRVLSLYLGKCMEYEEERIRSEFSRKQREKTKKKEIRDLKARRISDFAEIRNAIAHNQLFWLIYSKEKKRCLTSREVFSIAKEAIESRDFADKKQLLSDFHQQLVAPMLQENYDFLEKEGDNTLHKIKSWDADKIEEYKKSHYTVDKRKIFKKIVGKWKKDADYSFNIYKKNGRSKSL